MIYEQAVAINGPFSHLCVNICLTLSLRVDFRDTTLVYVKQARQMVWGWNPKPVLSSHADSFLENKHVDLKVSVHRAPAAGTGLGPGTTASLCLSSSSCVVSTGSHSQPCPALSQSVFEPHSLCDSTKALFLYICPMPLQPSLSFG